MNAEIILALILGFIGGTIFTILLTIGVLKKLVRIGNNN